MLKLKVGDKVKVRVGKDKGREGKIEKIIAKKEKAIVENINLYKKHVKGVSEQKGGIYDLVRPIDLGKLSLICPRCKKPTRVGFKKIAGKSVRVCKKCKREIDLKKTSKK